MYLLLTLSRMEFKKFDSIARLWKDMVISEKIDWTNACVVVDEEWNVQAQSRSQIITTQNDNYWFARYVEENKEELKKLWVWYHYWEWRGSGIQRKYWLDKKVFSQFVFRGEELPSCCSIVPYLYTWPFDTTKINEVMEELKRTGSIASPWFMNPEWIVIYHTASQTLYKKTFEYDEWKRAMDNSK